MRHEVTQFGAKKYEAKALKEIQNALSYVISSSFDDLICTNIKSSIGQKKIEIENLKNQLVEKENELSAIESIQLKVKLGESKLSPEYVEDMMNRWQEEITSMKQYVQALTDSVSKEQEGLENHLKNPSELKDLLRDWNIIFDSVDFNAQKMMLSKIIRVMWFKKNGIEFDLKLL